MTPAIQSEPRLWLDRHGDALFRFALARVGNHAAAEDLVQDTLLAGLRARETFAAASSERTWLVGILKHRIADHFRGLAREQPKHADGSSEAPGDFFSSGGKWLQAPMNWSALPGSSLETSEFSRILQDCLSALPDRLSAALAMREIAGMESSEVCRELQITPTHLWTLLHRARLRVRACLEINWFREDAHGNAKRTVS